MPGPVVGDVLCFGTVRSASSFSRSAIDSLDRVASQFQRRRVLMEHDLKVHVVQLVDHFGRLVEVSGLKSTLAWPVFQPAGQ